MKRGFTLIELLIVIGIIAILAAALIVGLSPAERFAQARDSVRERHINALYNSLTSYYVSYQGNWNDINLPQEPTEICNTNEVEPQNCGDLIDLSLLVDEGHITQIPVDPQAEGDGTGYLIMESSVVLIAQNAETDFIAVGISEEDFDNQVWIWPDLDGYIYNEGVHGDRWIEGYTKDDANNEKRDNYLYSEGEGGFDEGTWVTNSRINFSEWDTLKIDWVISRSDGADANHTVSEIDVSEIEEEFYVRIHGYGSMGFSVAKIAVAVTQDESNDWGIVADAGINASDWGTDFELRVYQVWLEKNKQ